MFEQLEPRVLLNGVTVITHGHNSSSVGWVNGMADAVADRISGDSAEYTLLLSEDSNNKPDSYSLIPDNPAQTYDTVDSGQAIIKLDWSDMTASLFDFGTSTTDVGHYVADWLAAGDFAQMPIHLIGHSRGASVNAAIAEKLAEYGIWADHVTMLDPYPVDGDSGVILYDNVRFADNFYQTDYSISGGPIAGAYNLGPLDLGGAHGFFSGGEHSDVHLWYHGTVDLSPAASADGYTVPASYYNGPQGPRTNAGFHYSLIAGGDRSELIGWLPSAANRTYAVKSGPQWANLGATLLFSGPASVEQGDDVPVSYRYQSVIASDISFGFDADRNPYNASQPQYADTIVMPATSDGTAFDNGIAETHDADTSQISPDAYYIVAKITADGRARYAYSDQQITIEPPPLLGDADDNGVVDDADLGIFTAEFGLRSSNLAADFDADGYVGLADLIILRENFGASLPVASGGLVTSVNRSTAIASKIDTLPATRASASTNESVVLVERQLSTPSSQQSLDVNNNIAAPEVEPDLSADEKDERQNLSPPVDRQLTGVLSADDPGTFLDSDNLLVDVLSEAVGSRLASGA